MEVFICQNVDDFDLMKDISDDVSLDPLLLISNLDKTFRDKDGT